MEQLRRAKRAQRARQRAAGMLDVQLTLPRETASKLAAARGAVDYPRQLDSALDRIVVRVRDYPQLTDLAWNRTDEFIPADEALRLYERNWRLIEPTGLDARERALIERLRAEYGSGGLNA
jgi:hypothetical protein